jgi:hypothetical protein
LYRGDALECFKYSSKWESGETKNRSGPETLAWLELELPQFCTLTSLRFTFDTSANDYWNIRWNTTTYVETSSDGKAWQQLTYLNSGHDIFEGVWNAGRPARPPPEQGEEEEGGEDATADVEDELNQFRPVDNDNQPKPPAPFKTPAAALNVRHIRVRSTRAVVWQNLRLTGRVQPSRLPMNGLTGASLLDLLSKVWVDNPRGTNQRLGFLFLYQCMIGGVSLSLTAPNKAGGKEKDSKGGEAVADESRSLAYLMAQVMLTRLTKGGQDFESYQNWIA